MPSSTTKVAVAKVLKEEGYITDYSVNKENKPLLLIELKYFEGKPVIEEIQRVSRPGLRQYRGKDDIPVVKGGLGIVIVSTNKGLMSDRAAREAGVGGELVCSVF
jgi:small subunit ribosomal protein S8